MNHDEKKIKLYTHSLRGLISQEHGKEIGECFKEYAELMSQRSYSNGYKQGRFDEKARLLNQKANEHDQEVIKQERDRIISLVNEVKEKNENNERYNACNEIIGLINKENG